MTRKREPEGGGHWRIDRVVAQLRKLHCLSTAERLARSYGLSLEEVLSRDGHAYVTQARHHLWTVIRHTLCLSYPELARIFEVDHSTILYAVHQREKKLVDDVG